MPNAKNTRFQSTDFLEVITDINDWLWRNFNTKNNPKRAKTNEISIRNNNKFELNMAYISISDKDICFEVMLFIAMATNKGTCPINEAKMIRIEPSKYFKKFNTIDIDLVSFLKACAINIVETITFV